MRRVLRDAHGDPVYPIGVNYWPRGTAVEMWTRWDPDGIARDLEAMRALGLNTVRFFLRTMDFADPEGNPSPEAMGKLDAFLSMCREVGLYAFPTLLVGHMSGMNFPIPWDRGCDLYTDPEARARTRRFVQAIVSRFRDEEMILGWILSNEIGHYAGRRGTHVLMGWLEEMYRAIRALDPYRPIGFGDGGDDLKGEGLGFPEGALSSIEDLRSGEDFVSLHHYYDDVDVLRLSHAPAGMVRLCEIGIPVLLEEFGVSTALWSEEAQADYFRIVLFSTWAAGAAGALAWCWSDFPTAHLPPYTHHPFELSFGIIRADGSGKPAAGEMSRFARLLGEVGASAWSPPPPQAAILVPSAFYVDYPFRSADRPRLVRALLGAYALARMAGLDVAFVREGEPLPETVRLILIPYGDLLAPTWRDLRDWVEGGGVLWAGFGGAVPNLRELFGVRPGGGLSRRGEGTPRRRVVLRFVKDIRDIDEGETLELPGVDAPHLPIVPLTAEVVAVDSEGRPAITVNAVGRGKTFFCSRSPEWLLAPVAGLGYSGVHRLYRALGDTAGIPPTFEVDRPTVTLNVLEKGDGARLLVAINHSGMPFQGEVRSREPLRRVVDVESGEELEVREGRFRLPLGPWGVRVLGVS